jgi:hypothetical protein
MTERPHEQPPAGTPAVDDTTRDIRLPPRSDRPPPAMPQAWAGLPRPPASDAPAPLSAPPADVAPSPDTARAPGTEAFERPGRAPATPLVDQPTDELGGPAGPPRERTLTFSSPEMSHRPVGPVHVARTPRRWPWLLLALLPILIIAGTGIALLLLLQGG